MSLFTLPIGRLIFFTALSAKVEAEQSYKNNALRDKMYKVVLFILVIGLTGCSTNKFIGSAASEFEKLSCELDENPCRISFSNQGYISYSISPIGDSTYRVKGDVDLFMQVVGGMRPRVSFFVVFMDEDQVKYERKVKTGMRKASFEFEVETDAPISKTSIAHVLYHTWS